MECSLLIGNGMNRTLGNSSISWDALIKDIAIKNNIEYIENLSLPLMFESVVNGILKHEKKPTDDVYLNIKKKIALKLDDVHLPLEAVHNNIRTLNADNILTTNYDCFLEQVYDENYHYEGNNKKKYLFERTSKYENTNFFHIHGFAKNPKSICLGYEHYVGLLQNIRTKIHSQNEYRIVNLLNGVKFDDENWADKFFTSNIHIFGLELAESEIDLWWLLTFRSYLYYSNRFGLRSKINNKIIYYDIIDDRNNNEKQNNKLTLLKSELVDVKIYNLSEFDYEYDSAYNKIISDINC